MKGLEYLYKNFPGQLFSKGKEFTSLRPDGTGKFTGINMPKLADRLQKSANDFEKLQDMADLIGEAKKNNPNNLPF